MVQVIEFYTPSHFRPKVKLPPQEQRGKVIAFMSHREEEAEIAFALAYETLNSQSSRWRDSWADESTQSQAPTGVIIFQASGSCMIPADSN
jgi:hypothetical protein